MWVRILLLFLLGKEQKRDWIILKNPDSMRLSAFVVIIPYGHTFATRALEAGMDVKVLSSLLGHADASTTLNKYGHALPDHKRESMDKMHKYFSGAPFQTFVSGAADEERITEKKAG